MKIRIKKPKVKIGKKSYLLDVIEAEMDKEIREEIELEKDRMREETGSGYIEPQQYFEMYKKLHFEKYKEEFTIST